MVWPTVDVARSKEEEMSMKLELFRKSWRERHSFQTIRESELWLKDSSKGDFGLLNLACKCKYLIYPMESLVNFTSFTNAFMRINYFQDPLRDTARQLIFRLPECGKMHRPHFQVIYNA